MECCLTKYSEIYPLGRCPETSYKPVCDDTFEILHKSIVKLRGRIWREIAMCSSNRAEQITLISIFTNWVSNIDDISQVNQQNLPYNRTGSKIDKKSFLLSYAWSMAYLGIRAIRDKKLDLTIVYIEVANRCLGFYLGNIAESEAVFLLEKYQQAPKINQEKTDKFWRLYHEPFDNYIAEGKKESWAISEIGNIIERAGVWRKRSKKDPEKILTRPDRGTIRRQLVTNRK